MLRIHDLKTGKSGHMEQLYVYAALFCLEYDVKPGDITIECRLYIEDTVEVERPTAEVIVITDLMGQGVDMVSGNYSRGAAGYYL